MSNKDTNLPMTKERERAELHRAIWQIVNELREAQTVDITELNTRIAGIVARQQQLRAAIDEIVADIEGSTIK